MERGSFEWIRFVAGPYDGRALPVPRPIMRELELRVLPPDPSGCSAFYSLGDDGRFHYHPGGRGDRSRVNDRRKPIRVEVPTRPQV
jgi:hypothetical protein